MVVEWYTLNLSVPKVFMMFCMSYLNCIVNIGLKYCLFLDTKYWHVDLFESISVTANTVTENNSQEWMS